MPPTLTHSSAVAASDTEIRGRLRADPGRYHLYLSLACPFSHRPYLVRSLLGLEQVVSASTVAARRHDDGWEFDADAPDPLHPACTRLNALYRRSAPGDTGPSSVPVIWDRDTDALVGNDSADIAWQLATTFQPLARQPLELVPTAKAPAIRQMTTWLQQHVNRKVYHVGFATTQEDYDVAQAEWFGALDELEARLRRQPYLHGGQLTLSDLFLLPTLCRVELVYHGHFKANLRPLSHYAALYDYLARLASLPAVRRTIDLAHTKLHYYHSHQHINPTRIVPAGPPLPWW